MAISVANITKLRTGVGASISGAIPDPADDDLMMVHVATYLGNSSNHAASDSENLAYTRIANVNASTGSTNLCISLHYFQNSALGSGSSGNASGGTGASGIVAIFRQVSGMSTSEAFVAGEFATSTGASSSPKASSVTNSTAAALFVAGFVNADGSPVALDVENATGTDGTWSTNSSGKETAANTYPHVGTVHQIVASSAARAHVWQSTNGAGSNWAAINAVFQGAGGAPPAVVVRHYRALLGVGR